MLMEYSKILNEFEYDTDNEVWIRVSDGKAFYLIEKDENDIARISEVKSED